MKRIPFDWRNPFVYLVVVTVQYIMEVCLVLTAGCTLILGIGCYMCSIAFSKSIKMNLHSISQKVDDESQRQCVMEQFIEFIACHSRVKQYSIFPNKSFNQFQVRLHFTFHAFLLDWSAVFQPLTNIILQFCLFIVSQAYALHS